MKYAFDWNTIPKAASGALPAEQEQSTRTCAAMIRAFWASQGAYPKVEVVFVPGRRNHHRDTDGFWTITSDMVGGLPKEMMP